ncbi:MAG: hypothetical protein GY862_32795 [Gammaproteobacteria bacterium]|nr:hypothetical protein [Gammaproteobacteria bacterium]
MAQNRQKPILVLNELSDEPHNVPLKCFASRRAEIRKAYRAINENRLPGQTLRLERMFNGLHMLLSDEEEEMKALAETDELTLEYVLETGMDGACVEFDAGGRTA